MAPSPSDFPLITYAIDTPVRCWPMTQSDKANNYRAQYGSRQPMFLGVTITLLILSLVVVSLRRVTSRTLLYGHDSDDLFRIHCRVKYIKSVGLDDCCIIAAMCVALALGVMNGIHISYGTG